MSDTSTSGGDSATDNDSRVFLLKKVYLKDLSYEEPSSPEALLSGKSIPTIGLRLEIGSSEMTNGFTEVVLRINLKAIADNRPCFILECDHAGMFSIEGYSDEERRVMIGSKCPASIFPFARETIWSVLGKGGFNAMMLQPIDFESLMQQILAEDVRFISDR